jgi:hypothetical protein
LGEAGDPAHWSYQILEEAKNRPHLDPLSHRGHERGLFTALDTGYLSATCVRQLQGD